MNDYASIKELHKGFEDADDIDEVESLIRRTLSHLEKTLSELKSERDRADKAEALVVEELRRANRAERRISNALEYAGNKHFGSGEQVNAMRAILTGEVTS